AGGGARQGGAAAVLLPARVAGRRRALGPLHVPRHRAARSVALPGTDGGALDAGRRLAPRGRDRRSHRPPRAAAARAACRPGAGEGGVRGFGRAEAGIGDLLQRLSTPPGLAPLALPDGADPPPPAVPTTTRYPRDAFERDVRRILEYIRAGDTFQTVLSRRQEAAGAVDPLLLYRPLRALNPAPYPYYP